MNAHTNPTVNTSSSTSPWMFDSGASHHVASNPTSFHTLLEYGGPNEIMLGNGNALSISHNRHTTLPTPSRPLHLHNVLFVPQMRNNLVSVAKLSKANNVFVEFSPIIFWLRIYAQGRISCME